MLLSLVLERPEGAPPWTAFLIALAVTVLLLVVTLLLGFQRRRRAHLLSAISTVLALLVAIYFAETVGSYWVFPKWPLRIHLSIAWAATGLILPVLVSGIQALRQRGRAPGHKKLVFLWLAVVLGAICTGCWIFLVGHPK